MKTPEEVTKAIGSRLTNKWRAHLVGDETAFPYAVPLGSPSAADLQADYAAIHAQTVVLQDWARRQNVTLDYENRQAKGRTKQTVPTHAHIDSIDHAAAIVAGGWPQKLARGRRRLTVLRERYPRIGDLGQALRIVEAYTPVDFELLCIVADWYLQDPTRAQLGVTPRQVPIPGVHAKWLQSHRPGVQALTGLADLGLLANHPSRIHFTYLDPDHRASGARLHDSATVGDTFTPAYLPQVVVISENKDTAIQFPPLAGGISVEGVGKGGKTPATFGWLREAPVVVYWGDIDRDGYEILNGYRTDFERDIDSILMDPATYEAYEQFGTNLDQHGNPLKTGDPKPVDKLHPDEQAMYLRVVDPDHTGHRRVEQERIPLARALEEVEMIRERQQRT